jgi:hypothetical protein
VSTSYLQLGPGEEAGHYDGKRSIRVDNVGPAGVTGFQVTVTAPAGFTPTGGGSGCARPGPGKPVRCSHGALAAAASAWFTVGFSTPIGELRPGPDTRRSVTVTVTDGRDTDLSNNRSVYLTKPPETMPSN